ncbi:MAG TPA: tRNA pseudouridine(38-40) synthase TruA [Longimicrobium sp.]|jgi:tRNA pseudouridine38-40 synthase|uniref:tRNA pseudouridine(38-40) synthase TruA n=1 Tax=Longimicrobium sp. TaxID=2029185 RepID=UPI002EDAC053
MNTPERHRIRFIIHYDGRGFAGWQVQPDQRTVQGELERILTKLTAGPCAVIGSGRTDRGVHATGQVAATDVPVRWTAQSLRRAMNALLPDDVWVAEATLAAPYFHPRYDATARSYVYRVGLASEADSPFRSPWCWPLVRPVDLLAMEKAAAHIVGDHSFRAFAKAGQEERGDRCTVTAARWAPWEGIGLEFHVTANRFLHHMVRYLVGTLVDIGLGQRPPEVMAALLAGEEGLETSPPAPPEGLFLTAVTYPPNAGMEPPRPRGPRLVP